MKASFDVVIIGGGMVGVSLAALLPEQLSIALIEKVALPVDQTQAFQPSFDGRSTALTQSSQAIFTAMDIWPDIEKHAQAIADVHVSDKGHWGSVLLSQKPQQPLGFVIENAALGKALLSKVKSKENIEFLCPASVASIKKQGEGVSLVIDDNGEEYGVSAKLAIIADGANSKTCQQLGIANKVTDYEHMAIVANIATEQAHKGIAYERFTKNGPMALLPLLATAEYRHRSALVWTLPSAKADELLALNEPMFLQRLQDMFGFQQGYFCHVGERSHYPLKLSVATEQVRNNIVVLGNAAHSLHPVAGQGFNLALRDVAMLVDVIEAALANSEDFASLQVLQRYLSLQENDQKITTIFSDALPKLFTMNNPLIQLGRNAGLLSLELNNLAKERFIDFSTGKRVRGGL